MNIPKNYILNLPELLVVKIPNICNLDEAFKDVWIFKTGLGEWDWEVVLCYLLGIFTKCTEAK